MTGRTAEQPGKRTTHVIRANLYQLFSPLVHFHRSLLEWSPQALPGPPAPQLHHLYWLLPGSRSEICFLAGFTFSQSAG